jgi:glucosamine 6-phosphate synthetase-like amidotransferase/phosphosugar isomerase protein
VITPERWSRGGAEISCHYAAMAKGTDIDQPRNLAKSVTVK